VGSLVGEEHVVDLKNLLSSQVDAVLQLIKLIKILVVAESHHPLKEAQMEEVLLAGEKQSEDGLLDGWLDRG
jgi:hypothetical protein